MLRYYKLFDLLFRKKMKLTDLREILSSATIAKLRKGEYISGEALDKLCEFLNCQPADIIEHYRLSSYNDDEDNEQALIAIKTINEVNSYGEELPKDIFVKYIKEPLDGKGNPINGWYEKELLDDYNSLDNYSKSEIDYENALLNKKIYNKIDELFKNKE